MLNRDDIFHLLTDEKNPVRMWLPDNAAILKLADYIANNYNAKELEDGVYAETFAVVYGIRYGTKLMNMKELSIELTKGLMDGVQKLWD